MKISAAEWSRSGARSWWTTPIQRLCEVMGRRSSTHQALATLTVRYECVISLTLNNIIGAGMILRLG